MCSSDLHHNKSTMERELQDCISQALKTDVKKPVTGARLARNKEMNLSQGGGARGRYRILRLASSTSIVSIPQTSRDQAELEPHGLLLLVNK